jgi:anion-transporting  ArsA/GET3 family ATPase
VRRLLAEWRVDRRVLADRCAEVRRFSQPAAAVTDERVSALALALARTYSTVEALLERTARTLEGGTPPAEDWHRALLRNATLKIEHVRPAILSAQSVDAADELRRFRHFLVHAYAADLNASRLQSLAAQWVAALPTIEAELDQFESFLQQLAETLERA